jgi:hypothetical protein
VSALAAVELVSGFAALAEAVSAFIGCCDRCCAEVVSALPALAAAVSLRTALADAESPRAADCVVPLVVTVSDALGVPEVSLRAAVVARVSGVALCCCPDCGASVSLGVVAWACAALVSRGISLWDCCWLVIASRLPPFAAALVSAGLTGVGLTPTVADALVLAAVVSTLDERLLVVSTFTACAVVVSTLALEAADVSLGVTEAVEIPVSAG